MNNVKNIKRMSKAKRISTLIFVSILFFVLVSSLFSACSCSSLNAISKELTNYNLVLSFDDDTKTLTGEQSINYINSTQTVLNEVWFHLYPNAFSSEATIKPVSNLYKEKAYPNGEDYGGIEVTSVKVENVEQDVVITLPDNETLIVKLSDELFPDDRVNIKINYSVLLPNCLHRFGYGDNTYNFGNFYPVACVYENGSFKTDAYGNNGDPFYSEMANYNVTIIYDEEFTLASSGKQLNTTIQDAKKQTNIKASVVRDFAFVLSKKFQVVSAKAGDTNVYYYYYDDENFEKSLQAGVDAINTFSNLFGDYPYETFSIVKANFIHGGMEYPNLVYISDSVVQESEYLNVIIHETAHQWWYNLVGSNACEYAWLDEGLTEYSTLMFYKYNSNYQVDIKDSLNSSLSSYLLYSEICTSIYGKFDSSMSRNVNTFKGDLDYVYVTYVKGVLFFDNLNELVGSKKFEKSLKQYFKDNKYKNATPDDIISAFEKVCKRNLKNFFDSWVSGKVVLQNYS